jgi:hypothetical protein
MLRNGLDLPIIGQDFSEHLQEYPPNNCYKYKHVNEFLVLRRKCNRQVLCRGTCRNINIEASGTRAYLCPVKD